MAFVMITTEEYQQLIKRIEVLEKALIEKSRSKWVGNNEAMEILQCKHTTLWNLRKADAVKYRFQGRRVFYETLSLMDYVERGTR